MTESDPSFLFLGLVLPSLFALTLIAEGVWKLSKNTSGWVNIGLGAGALLMVAFFYFFVL